MVECLRRFGDCFSTLFFFGLLFFVRCDEEWSLRVRGRPLANFKFLVGGAGSGGGGRALEVGLLNGEVITTSFPGLFQRFSDVRSLLTESLIIFHEGVKLVFWDGRPFELSIPCAADRE